MGEPGCVDDLGFRFGSWSKVKDEPKEHGEEGDEYSAFPGGLAIVDAGLVVVRELCVRRHGGGRGLKHGAGRRRP